MTGVIVNREGVLYIKDGEDLLKIHPTSFYGNYAGDVVEFSYVVINKIKYGEIKNKIKSP